MTDKQKWMPWMDGLPTRPDVDALLRAFPPDQLVPGKRISDEEMYAIIGACGATRYRTVYSAFQQRLLKDHSVVLKREKMTGFFVPTPAEVMADTHPTFRHIGSTARKQMANLAAIKPAEGVEAQTRDHHGRLLGSIKREAKKSRMNILPPSAVQASPQIEPPKKVGSA